MARFKRSEIGTTKIVQVNRYQDPKYAIELIAKICMEKPSDYSQWFNPLYEMAKKENGLVNFFKSNRSEFNDIDFLDSLQNKLYSLQNAYAANETIRCTQIVVAGGFSSGKSSLLNYITGAGELLPTGIDPVSVVATNILCRKDIKSIKIKGENLHGKLVALPFDVMECIQHSSKSNVYIATVLNKLFVEVPNEKLDCFMFVDTPGYDNQDSADSSGKRSDLATAQNELKDGDVLFWLIDIDKGTVTTEDIKMINTFAGKKVVIFNKADKKPDVEDILKAAEQILTSGLNQPESLIDIIALSSHDPNVYSSLRGNSLEDILSIAKKVGEEKGRVSEITKSTIENLFDDEITHFRSLTKDLEKSYKEQVSLKNESLTDYDEYSRNAKNEKIEFKDILVESYDNIVKTCDTLCNCSIGEIELMRNCLKKIRGVNKAAWVTHTSINDLIRESLDQLNRLENDHKTACGEYESYNSKYRETCYNKISYYISIALQLQKGKKDNLEKLASDIKKEIQKLGKMSDALESFKHEFIEALNGVIAQCDKCSRKDNSVEYTESEPKSICIFNAIANSDFDQFYLSFTNKIDIKLCNDEGYSPLTYAVMHGENEMVEFLVKHTDDITEYDKRGFNALHTAIENQFKDLSKLLITQYPELVNTTTQCGMTIKEIAEKNKNHFYEWIQSTYCLN